MISFLDITQTMHVLWLVVVGVLIFIWYKSRSSRSHPLPPGPPADPFIGHLRVLPKKHLGPVFHSWAQSYGDVLYLGVLGRSFVILDTVRTAAGLLETSSAIFSHRPKLPVCEILGFGPILSLLPYGHQFRMHRKILHSHFVRNSVHTLEDIQTKSARSLASSLLEKGSDYDDHMFLYSLAVSAKAAYGLDITSVDNEYAQLVKQSRIVLKNAGPTGRTAIDFFPILKKFPSWFPGTYYVQYARKWRPTMRRLFDHPFDIVRQDMIEGKAGPSVLAIELTKLSERESVNEENLDALKGAAAAISTAGVETTWSTLAVFLLAMVMFPEAQMLAHEELDRVVGRDRLPEFSDFDSLPYIECLTQEVLRWHPVLPLGIPRQSTQADVFRDMLIPKDSLIIANLFGMSMDESVYANPARFYPSRFLHKPSGSGEPFFSSAFGFGRRICPGRHLATASLWIAMATILATTEISKAEENTDGIDFIPSFSAGLITRPEKIPCKIQSRHAHVPGLLQQHQSE